MTWCRKYGNSIYSLRTAKPGARFRIETNSYERTRRSPLCPSLCNWFGLFVLAIPIACIAWTVTHEEIFREPRDYCKRQCKDAPSLLQRKFFYLFTCEFCFSHYITITVLISHSLQAPGAGLAGICARALRTGMDREPVHEHLRPAQVGYPAGAYRHQGRRKKTRRPRLAEARPLETEGSLAVFDRVDSVRFYNFRSPSESHNIYLE